MKRNELLVLLNLDTFFIFYTENSLELLGVNVIKKFLDNIVNQMWKKNSHQYVVKPSLNFGVTWHLNVCVHLSECPFWAVMRRWLVERWKSTHSYNPISFEPIFISSGSTDKYYSKTLVVYLNIRKQANSKKVTLFKNKKNSKFRFIT